MVLTALKQTVQTVCRLGECFSGADKEYVMQFAFRTGDGELTDKLIDELLQTGADRKIIYQKFNTLVDFQPDWIRSIENLLISLELYRVQEEKALKTLAEILSVYGIELSEKEIRELPPDKFREYARRIEYMQR